MKDVQTMNVRGGGVKGEIVELKLATLTLLWVGEAEHVVVPEDNS